MGTARLLTVGGGIQGCVVCPGGCLGEYTPYGPRGTYTPLDPEAHPQTKRQTPPPDPVADNPLWTDRHLQKHCLAPNFVCER